MEWNYCNELLPDTDDLYNLTDEHGHTIYTSEPLLVTYLSAIDGKPTTSYETAMYNSYDDKWYWGNDEDGLKRLCLVEIIAWMPLPSPAEKREK